MAALWVFGCVVGCGPLEGECVPTCDASSYCAGGVCRPYCGGEEFLCGGRCVDPRADREHCGGCDRRCGAEESCLLGVCVGPCPVHTSERCGRGCVNLQTDGLHCGACERACGASQTCQAGECKCAPGTVLCGERCVTLASDAQHCGGCGNACAEGSLCAGGQCIQGACPQATPDICFGGCVDRQKDRHHCGTCGSSCPQQQVCVSSTCVCPTGLVRCGEEHCVDLQTDRAHCGGCGQVCGQGQVCAGGQCVATCPEATATPCFGGCVDTQQNALHCGGCGVRCEPGVLCKQGICCAVEKTICGGACVDLANDTAHCGGCGQVCAAGAVCLRGKCCTDGCSYARLFGGTGYTYGRAMGKDRQGHLYIGGNLLSPNAQFGVHRLDSGIAYAIFVAKVKADGGDVLWVRSFRGMDANSNHAYDIDTDLQGNVYVTGRFAGTLQVGSLTLTSVNAQYDAYVIKLTPDGVPVWAVSVGGTGEEMSYGIAVDGAGQATITGFTTSPSLGGISIVPRGSRDVFVARLDAQGKLLWVVTGGTVDSDIGQGVVLRASGDAYITGRAGVGSARFGESSTSLTAAESTFVAKVTAAGVFAWVRYFPNSWGYSVALQESVEGGLLCVGGSMQGNALFDETSLASSGGMDGYVACLTLDGALRWVRRLGGVESGSRDFVRDIAMDAKGQVHATGMFDSAVLVVESKTFPNKAAGRWDHFLVRYDAKGTLVFADTMGGASIEEARHVEVSDDGGSYVLGYSQSNDYQFNGKAYPFTSSTFAVLLYLGP